MIIMLSHYEKINYCENGKYEPKIAIAQVGDSFCLGDKMTCTFRGFFFEEDRLVNVLRGHQKSLEDRSTNNVNVKPASTFLFRLDFICDALKQNVVSCSFLLFFALKLNVFSCYNSFCSETKCC
jgi:hypothetical protein